MLMGPQCIDEPVDIGAGMPGIELHSKAALRSGTAGKRTASMDAGLAERRRERVGGILVPTRIGTMGDLVDTSG